MCFKNFRPVGNKDGEPATEPGSVCLWVSLTVVGNTCAAEIEFNELSAAQQTSPHHCVSHLGAGQPQHLQNRMVLDELFFIW